ncbi:MAG TPA: ATP-binding protein [Abditibacteriaceae bacterium]|nr:ATP-binding protein [Abditibacteriaceae bacterium]
MENNISSQLLDNLQAAPPRSAPSRSAPGSASAGSASAAISGDNGKSDGLPSAAELEQTLRRLLRRVAMMIQAEKCVFLLYEPERDELVARLPALGLTPDEVKRLRVPVEGGVSAAFRTSKPLIVTDMTQADPLDLVWMQRVDVRNLIAFPLIIERHDEQDGMAESAPVGLLLVINKRGAESFSDEDLRMLSIMARQVTAVIADAQLYLRLTEEKDQLRAILRSLLAGVVMVEPDGHISLINPAACQMFGMAEAAVVGNLYNEVIVQRPIVEMLCSALEEGIAAPQEIEVEPPRGSEEPRIFQAQTTFVRGEVDGLPTVLGVVAIFNDITEIRNVDRMKTAFVSTVSHELRTPLTSIKGFIDTLLQDTEGYFADEDRLEFYDIINSECDRLQRLIEDLLNVSRIEAGRALQMNWATFDPLPVIAKVLQAQRVYAKEHHLRMQAQGHVPDILSDIGKFEQILTNLLSNAIKYSPAGGEIVVAVSSDVERLTVAVSDHGIGIPTDKLPRLFEKFERIDNRDTRQVGGTGIGLFLVRNYVQSLGGEVWADSVLGQGSTFTFQLPIHSDQADAEMQQLAASEEADLKQLENFTRGGFPA